MMMFGLCVLLASQAVNAPPAVNRQLIADAERGDAEAQFKLGRAYAEGLGVPPDNGKAVVHYRRAAEQGHALAMYALGWSYFRGEGVDASDVEGLRWIRKAADQGSGEAQVSLGDIYDTGSFGLDEDQRLAFFWNHQAASKGYVGGAAAIANMYEFGDVLPKNLVLAYAWRSLRGTLAVRAGGGRDDDALRELEQNMTRPQVAAATKLVREWGGKVPPLATISDQPVTAAPKADAATFALARTLTAEFQGERYFLEATRERPESLAALAHLALTSKEAPLVQAAYDAMGRQLASIAAKRQDPRTVQPLVIAAIMAGLRRGERPILDKALGAAAALNLGEQGHTRSLEAMADMALKHREPDVRYAALNALYQTGIHVCSRSDLVPEVMALAMEDASEAVVVMNMAIFNTMGRMSPFFTARHAQIARSFGRLRKEGSPALRAAAIAATAKMFDPGIELPGVPRPAPGPDAKAFAAELLRTLDDPSPIVRGQAAAAVGLLRFAEGGIPKLVAMLDDTASVSGAVSGLRSLSSNDPIELPVRVVDLGEPETVAMAALRALMLRSLYQDSKPQSRLKCDDPAKSFAECAARARAWGRRAAGSQPAPKAPPPLAPWAPPANAVRVGGPIAMPDQLVRVEAEYPEEARRQGASGVVIVEAMIGLKGEIAAVHLVRGVKGLDQAALDAVRQWVFEPTSVGGKPVPVIATLTVNFRR